MENEIWFLGLSIHQELKKAHLEFKKNVLLLIMVLFKYWSMKGLKATLIIMPSGWTLGTLGSIPNSKVTNVMSLEVGKVFLAKFSLL